MSGHSKWSTIKRKKGAEDQKRGALFTKLARAITLAVREGGGIDDPTSNFKLRLAMDRAKQYNMPKDNIQRAIDRGSGKGSDADAFQSIVYEGYGPEGVAFIIDSATDNKQRTAAQVKHILDRSGGSLGSPGSVSYLFDHVGLIHIAKQVGDEDTVFEKAIDAGAIDVESGEEYYEIYTSRDDLHAVKDALETSLSIHDADLLYKPKVPIELEDKLSERIIAIMEQLDDLDDVQNVYTNAS